MFTRSFSVAFAASVIISGGCATGPKYSPPAQPTLQSYTDAATGSADLMEMAHFDIGEVLRKERRGAPKAVRLVIGNPLIMKEMVKHVPDAASYAPVTVLIDERPDGVCLSYDLMASLLAPYGSAEASAVARQLDDKVMALLTAAAE